MDPALRLVTQTPLSALWDADGLDLRLSARAGLSSLDVRTLLREPSAAFVVADVGHPIRWIRGSDRYAFWKHEVAARLAEPGSHVHLEDFPAGYCYFADEWAGADGRVVVLTKLH